MMTCTTATLDHTLLASRGNGGYAFTYPIRVLPCWALYIEHNINHPLVVTSEAIRLIHKLQQKS